MRHGNFEQQPDTPFNWRIIAHLVPYLRDSRGRVGLALLCLLAAKGAILVIPFLLKHLVDSLNEGSAETLAGSVLVGLVLAYGAARFSNVLFSELRDTVFGRVDLAAGLCHDDGTNIVVQVKMTQFGGAGDRVSARRVEVDR